MRSIGGTARSTGVLYALMALPVPFSLIYLPRRFIVPGDAAATAHSILASELLYRIGILTSLVSSIAFVFLAVSLYGLLEDIDRHQVRLMAMFVSIAVGIGMIDLVLLAAPLVLLSGANFRSAFGEAQLDALALGALRWRNAELGVASAFWGLWLLPLGILVLRSGFIPRVIGVLLIVACVAYLAQSATIIVFPAYARAVSRVTLPLAAPGELSMIVWLLVKGGRVPLKPPESHRRIGIQ